VDLLEYRSLDGQGSARGRLHDDATYSISRFPSRATARSNSGVKPDGWPSASTNESGRDLSSMPTRRCIFGGAANAGAAATSSATKKQQRWKNDMGGTGTLAQMRLTIVTHIGVWFVWRGQAEGDTSCQEGVTLPGCAVPMTVVTCGTARGTPIRHSPTEISQFFGGST